MKTTSEIQQYILDKTGLKTGVRKLHGSMKGYFMIYPLFQNNEHPKIPFELGRELKAILKSDPVNPTFCSVDSIDVHESNGFTNDAVKMKSERRQKSPEEMKVKGWGSKNSQLRLDKATARLAKRMQNGTTGVRFY